MKLSVEQMTNQASELEMATQLLNLEEFEVVAVRDNKKQCSRFIEVVPKVAADLWL